MSKVASISGATGSEIDALRDKAREMGSKTKFSASEAADAMSYMAMAGWKTSDMLNGIEGIMNLAAASGEDLATTSDIVTDALTAFGLTAGEEIVSPVKQIVRGFMERKLAVGALCVVIAMFLLVFIGPLFMTTYTDTYTEVTQANLPPTMSMLSVPSELKNDIKMIDSYGSFSVGLSNAGKVYVWGATGLGTTGISQGLQRMYSLVLHTP